MGWLIVSGLHGRLSVSRFLQDCVADTLDAVSASVITVFLVVSDIYKYCHLALKAGAIGDRLAMFVMFIIAPIAAGLALWIGLVFLLPL